MVRNNADWPQPARQVTCKYWSLMDNNLDKEFYAALQPVVVEAIRKQFGSASSRRIRVGREAQVDIGSYHLRARVTSIDPVLANTVDVSTSFIALYHERPRDEHQDISAFIAEIIRYPNEQQGATYQGLVGLNRIKTELEQKLRLLLSPEVITNWAQQFYPSGLPQDLMRALQDRYPLIVLEGEVGSGKTALARSIGHPLALSLQAQVALFVVNAQVRGGGHVGELTQNISRAFEEAERYQEQEQIPVLMLIDEADALARVRGTQYTHHEDDAGVNTLIQRIDRLRGRPMAVIFSTNLFLTLDAAILRRATASFHFNRPDFEQRKELFRSLLGSLGMRNAQIEGLAQQTNPRLCSEFGDGLFHRFTYSDISQRVIPYAVENVVARRGPLELRDVQMACRGVLPTRDVERIVPQFLEDYAPYFEPGHSFASYYQADSEDGL